MCTRRRGHARNHERARLYASSLARERMRSRLASFVSACIASLSGVRVATRCSLLPTPPPPPPPPPLPAGSSCFPRAGRLLACGFCAVSTAATHTILSQSHCRGGLPLALCPYEFGSRWSEEEEEEEEEECGGRARRWQRILDLVGFSCWWDGASTEGFLGCEIAPFRRYSSAGGCLCQYRATSRESFVDSGWRADAGDAVAVDNS